MQWGHFIIVNKDQYFYIDSNVTCGAHLNFKTDVQALFFAYL
jgi:hypothetical protein